MSQRPLHSKFSVSLHDAKQHGFDHSVTSLYQMLLPRDRAKSKILFDFARSLGTNAFLLALKARAKYQSSKIHVDPNRHVKIALYLFVNQKAGANTVQENF